MTEHITEYHCCDPCEYKFPVPADRYFERWELACSKKRSEVNKDGGLTSCPVWKNKFRSV